MKNHLVDTLVAAALGAAAMYYLDPEMGRRRRTVLRDQAAGRAREARQYVRRQARWTGDRLQGMAAQVRHAASTGVPASDRKIHERVRTAIGRAVSTPGAIDVNVSAGNVLLTGHVLAAEREKLIQAVSDVQGVEQVSDQLAEYGAAGNVPELQGAREPESMSQPAAGTMSQSAGGSASQSAGGTASQSGGGSASQSTAGTASQSTAGTTAQPMSQPGSQSASQSASEPGSPSTSEAVPDTMSGPAVSPTGR